MLGLHLLLSKLNSEDVYLQKATQSIKNQIASINSIVNNLLQLKNSSDSEGDENSNHRMILDTINKISTELSYKLIEKNIALINTVDLSPNIVLPISSQKLYITLLNLMTNAIKHSPEDNKIEIFAKSDGIYIRDYGSGIDPDIMSKIGKENIGKSDPNTGSGLGLMLVSNLLLGSRVELHFENVEGGTLAGIKVV
jgi:signal transduction histidine kinase